MSDIDGKPCRIDGEWHSTRLHHDSERDARVRAQLRAEIAKGVEGLPEWTGMAPSENDRVDRVAVLALIRGETE